VLKFGWAILLVWAVAGWISPAVGVNLPDAMQAPSSAHWLGTDALGRDEFLLISEGLRVSIGIGLISTLLATAIGSVWGAFAAMKGGKTDAFLMRAADAASGLPLVLVAVLIMIYAGRGMVALFITIAAFAWATLARVVRARLIEVRSRDYVRAAKMAGANSFEIWWRHYIPQAWGTIVAYSALNLPAILILEATLSYLGLGVQPPSVSLGGLLRDGAEGMTVAPWLMLAPAVVFVGLLAAFNLSAEKLRERL
jgi:oligopeptide transport system permease protein